MNIVRENRENQTALLKVTVSESDYAEQVDKKLHEFRRKANIPGFRPGMVPMSVINKMYRRGTVAEVAYKVASDACFEYIDKENIDYMGDVMPADEQGSFDFDNDSEHEFLFEIGLAPEVNIELTDKDKITRYAIKVDDKMRESYRTNFMRRYGHLVDVESVKADEAVIGTLDNGQIKAEEAYVGLISMSEEARKPFIGKKVGDVMTVNIEALYPTAAQRASVLGLKEDALADVAPEFQYTITQIRQFAEPELNEEFYKTAFPEGDVTDQEGLNKYFDSQIEAELTRESDYLFYFQLRKYLLDKAALALPEDFLRRWLFAVNEGKYTMEQIDADFASFLDMMRWSVVQKHYVRLNNLSLTEEEVKNEAKAMAASQFAQYGMMNVGDEVLDNYASSMLAKKEEQGKIVDKLYERKVLDAVKEQIKSSKKSVSADEFNKIAAEATK